VLGQLLEEIAPAVAPSTLVISIAASTTTSFIQQKLGKDIPVVRAMPNTPAMVGRRDDGCLRRPRRNFPTC